MAWLWIIFGVLVIVGSLSWLMPSPRERREAKARQEAMRLGLKVRMLSLDAWAKERMPMTQLAQYARYTDMGLPLFTLWRVADREIPWTAPPGNDGWRLFDKGLSGLLTDLPEQIVAVGADSGRVWVGFDDGATNAPSLEMVSERLQVLQQWLEQYQPVKASG